MPENKAVGLDRLPGRLLRAAALIISEPLVYILNLSLQSGKFISEWKHAKVLPLFKSGPAMETNNYRPISILPILSKLLEHFVHSSFSEYFEEHNLLIIAQSGFRRLHSTVTSLLHVTDRWLMNIDKGLVTGVVFDTIGVNIHHLVSHEWNINDLKTTFLEGLSLSQLMVISRIHCLSALVSPRAQF